MAVDLLASAVTAAAVEEAAAASSATRAIGCGRNTGTWTSSRNLRKTSTSSIPTLAAGLRYVVGVSAAVMQH